jgi:tRNAThr (cytosine32-N3)-methyltransferase
MEPAAKRPVIRNRKLEDPNSVWDHNSWDDVEWDEVKEQEAEAVLTEQLSSSTPTDPSVDVITPEAASKWNTFYAQHERSFFKDRHWLSAEFPELFVPDSAVLELGCGAGNTILPLSEARKTIDSKEELLLHACDFAPNAVELVKSHELYDPSRLHCFLHDLAQDEAFEEIQEGSIDTVICIFVLSALDPTRLPFAFSKIARVLKPDGLLLFRDYGRYDMTQLRFKPARLIRPDLYFRGDGTAVHYFSNEELAGLAEDVGLEVVRNETDRRLLVNRQRKLTMYRIWIQAKFRKPLE